MAPRLASPEEIRIRMIQRKLTQEKIALTANVTRNAISQVINSRLHSPRLRTVIAEALGWPASRLWADAGKDTDETRGGRRKTARVLGR